MDLMMYIPKVEDELRIIQERLIRMGATGTYAYEGAEQAFNELLGMGKYIAGHLLNAWEKPPSDGVSFSKSQFYGKLNRLLVHMIERGDLSLAQLQRYRRLITSEKL